MRKRTWEAGKAKKKPDFDSEQVTEELLELLIEEYRQVEGKYPSLRKMMSVLKERDIEGLNPLKIRKLLITAGVYESPISDAVLELWNDGKTVEEIQAELKLSRAAVHSYLPYSKIIYKLDKIPGGDRSVNADRQHLYLARKNAVKKLKDTLMRFDAKEQVEQEVWNVLILFQGYPFVTTKGLKFSYTIKGNEIFFSRRERSITRATVNNALQKSLLLGEKVTGPKALGVFGASYLYPVFVRIGILTKN